tara:strand:+ start:702 stop:1382 length:681 start_codon:yes stop_codon:yes gene_type:complete
MKRIITGLILGLLALFFVFLTNDIQFKIGLAIILGFSIYELLKIKAKKNVFFCLIFFMILINIFLIFPITNNLGRSFFFTVILISVFTDIFAFVFGKLFGKRFIYQSISPNKTLEGTFSGLFFPGALFLALGYLFIELKIPGAYIFNEFLVVTALIDSSGYVITFIITTISSLASIVGDLFASKLKRLSGIKDFGILLPGHGGILDRIDSHLFCIPIFLIIYILIQ